MRITAFFTLMAISTASYSTCWDEAAGYFNIDPRLLNAIAQVESGMKADAYNSNNNGSYDVGLMQIDSSHFSRLKKLGVDEHVLVNDPCISVLVGASILSEMIGQYGYTWEAVGAYNAGMGEKRHDLRMKYAYRVWLRYQKLKER